MTAAVLPAMDRVRAVLDFWFGAAGTPEHAGLRGIWFKKNAALDAAIREQHLQDYEPARDGTYDAWQSSARPSLALVIVLDQFPRNLFRGNARAFATDVTTLAVAQHAIANEFDRAAPPYQRIFYYIPFEHSEDLSCKSAALN